MGKLDIPYTQKLTTVYHNGFWCQWCCGCGLRHIYYFRVIRGKTPKDDRIEMTIEMDGWATLAAKKIARLTKKIKALKGE